MPKRLVLLADWTVDHFWNFFTGIFFAFFAYFSEMKGAFHVMFAAFVLDVLLGIWNSRKVAGERFSMTKLFIAFERMFISYALVMILYAMDKEMHQDTVSLANLSSWIITGFLAYSAAENGYEITGGKFFKSLATLIKNKVKDNTNIDLDE